MNKVKNVDSPKFLIELLYSENLSDDNKLQIIIRNKNEFKDNEWKKFKTMRDELYKYDTSMYNFQQ